MVYFNKRLNLKSLKTFYKACIYNALYRCCHVLSLFAFMFVYLNYISNCFSLSFDYSLLIISLLSVSLLVCLHSYRLI